MPAGPVRDGCVSAASRASLDATLRTVNTLRSFAGHRRRLVRPDLQPPGARRGADDEGPGDLSHTPGPDWPCYSDACARRAVQPVPRTFTARHVVSSTMAVVDSLGHRRWVIDPARAGLRLGRPGRRTRSTCSAISSRRCPRDAGVLADRAASCRGRGSSPTGRSPSAAPRRGLVLDRDAQVRVSLDGDPLTSATSDARRRLHRRTLSLEVAFRSATAATTISRSRSAAHRQRHERPISYTAHAFHLPDRPRVTREGNSPRRRRAEGCGRTRCSDDRQGQAEVKTPRPASRPPAEHSA